MDDTFYQSILNAMPLIIFVVDEDIQLLDANTAALAEFGQQGATVLNRRGGEVLHCLHAAETAGGCGRSSFCPRCLIRSSVTSALEGHAITRRRVKVNILKGETRKEAEYLITAAPMPEPYPKLALLILEDITEVTKLRDLLPICANCKKIRNDQQYWCKVESYFADYIGVGFTHCICPDCIRRLYPDIAEGICLAAGSEDGKQHQNGSGCG